MPRRAPRRAFALAALMLGATLTLASAGGEPHRRRGGRDDHLSAALLGGPHLGNARLPRQGSTSRAQKKVNKAYEKATEAVAVADAKFIATKIKSSADVKATVAQGRAEVASAALGAATRAKVVPLMLVPGKLGWNARAEVQGAATQLVASAVGAHEDKVEALADAAAAVGKAAEKKAYAQLKADAKVDKAVLRAERKSGNKIVQLKGTGVAGPSILPAVAPIVTPKPALIGGGGGFFGLPKAAAAGFSFGLGGNGQGALGKRGGFGFGRRLMQQQQTQPNNGLNGGAALAMFANAAVAFGTQLQQLAAQAQQQQPMLLPEAGSFGGQPQPQQFMQQQQPQPQQPYNPAALGGFAPALAGALGTFAPAAQAGGGGALSPRTQAVIGAVSGAAGLALNAAAPLVRSVASVVPVMVPSVDGECAAGKKVRVDGQGTFCVLGSWEPAAQALMNGAGLATAAAGPAASGVASLIASTRSGNGGGGVSGGNGRGGAGAGRPPRDQASPRSLD